MFEKWISAVDKGKLFIALLTDLCKTFFCLLLDLLLVKFYVYGFSFSAIKSVDNYLTNRK